MLKVSVLITLLVPLIAVVSGQQPETVRIRGEPVLSQANFKSPLANSEQWFLRAIDEVLNLDKRGGESNKSSLLGKEVFEKIFQNLFAKFPIGQPNRLSTLSSTPPATTTTTSTTTTTPAPTTADPMRQIGRSLQNIGAVLGSSGVQLIETPMKVLNSLLTTGANLTRVSALGLDEATAGLVSGTKLEARPGAAGKAERRNDEQFRDQMEDDLQYYEFAGPNEPWAYRRPKYFSRECPFRFACEVGKLIKPLTYPVSKAFETNRFIQDLHNRYTRAMTYGTIRGDCERYYCVLVKMLGGPVGFASGVAEIVNRIINSDLYKDYEFNDQRVAPVLALPSAQTG